MDLDATQAAYDDLSQEIQKIGAEMYKTAEQSEATPEDDSVRVKNVDEDGPQTVDAEVVEDDTDKK